MAALLRLIHDSRHASGAADTVARQDKALRLMPAQRRPLGQILIEHGAVRPADLIQALALRRREQARLGDILLAHGWVTEQALMTALTVQFRTGSVDLKSDPPDADLSELMTAEFCLSHGLIAWRRFGDDLIIATSRPDEFAAIRAELPRVPGKISMVIATESDISNAVLSSQGTGMIQRAETRVLAEESCRSHDGDRLSRNLLLGLACLTAALTFAPTAVFWAVTLWTVLTLVLTSGLKLLAFVSEVRAQARKDRGAVDAPPPPAEMPLISVMVPMFKEPDIARRLVARLTLLDYPRELLDVLLVVEEEDDITRAALKQADLPRWMRVVVVPDGPLRTKPRALNYALEFCKGSIVGVWDAEDRPEPSQLRKIAAHFARADEKVVCLQGKLDYYNPRVNWLARCFTVEYAAWFRAMLPGLARLGFLIPLGGTTLFFRRKALEELGGWDAHNVTEDADLGVRLARRGWRTELTDTLTHEEANCRALPWVKQRSRWLKGYAMTWGVHMRKPVQLWRDLGAKKFIGFQIQFWGTLSQYLLAPVLWSFWLIALGLWHPLTPTLEQNGSLAGTLILKGLFLIFLTTEVINLLVNLWATRSRDHRHLWPWTATMHVYFPLGALAGWKAITEVVTKPFYWDKTAHGIFDGDDHETAPAPAPLPRGLPQTATVPVERRGQIS